MHSDAQKHTDDKVYREVKECADNGDIRGLRYIFLSCLDVDPTFKKYERSFEDYKDIPGLFVLHTDEGLMPMTDNYSKWNIDYWNGLKKDLLENFSHKRFRHMRDVAKVIYADKISRLEKERNKVVPSTESIATSQSPKYGNETFGQNNQDLADEIKPEAFMDSCNDKNIPQNSQTDALSSKQTGVEARKSKKDDQEYNEAKKIEDFKKTERSEKRALDAENDYIVILRTETQHFSLHRKKGKLKVTTFDDREMKIYKDYYDVINNASEKEKISCMAWETLQGKDEADYHVEVAHDKMKKQLYYKVQHDCKPFKTLARKIFLGSANDENLYKLHL